MIKMTSLKDNQLSYCTVLYIMGVTHVQESGTRKLHQICECVSPLLQKAGLLFKVNTPTGVLMHSTISKTNRCRQEHSVYNAVNYVHYHTQWTNSRTRENNNLTFWSSWADCSGSRVFSSQSIHEFTRRGWPYVTPAEWYEQTVSALTDNT